jgi:hypothetical protein
MSGANSADKSSNSPKGWNLTWKIDQLQKNAVQGNPNKNLPNHSYFSDAYKFVDTEINYLDSQITIQNNDEANTTEKSQLLQKNNTRASYDSRKEEYDTGNESTSRSSSATIFNSKKQRSLSESSSVSTIVPPQQQPKPQPLYASPVQIIAAKKGNASGAHEDKDKTHQPHNQRSTATHLDNTNNDSNTGGPLINPTRRSSNKVAPANNRDEVITIEASHDELLLVPQNLQAVTLLDWIFSITAELCVGAGSFLFIYSMVLHFCPPDTVPQIEWLAGIFFGIAVTAFTSFAANIEKNAYQDSQKTNKIDTLMKADAGEIQQNNFCKRPFRTMGATLVSFASMGFQSGCTALIAYALLELQNHPNMSDETFSKFLWAFSGIVGISKFLGMLTNDNEVLRLAWKGYVPTLVIGPTVAANRYFIVHGMVYLRILHL